jgi:hypothetical protein
MGYHENQRGSARLFELEDILVGMRDVEVSPHQFGGQIRVDPLGVQALDQVLQLAAFGVERGDPPFPVFEHCPALAPRPDAVRACQSQRAEQQQVPGGAEATQLLPDGAAPWTWYVHAPTESQLTLSSKPFARGIA